MTLSLGKFSYIMDIMDTKLKYQLIRSQASPIPGWQGWIVNFVIKKIPRRFK